MRRGGPHVRNILAIPHERRRAELGVEPPPLIGRPVRLDAGHALQRELRERLRLEERFSGPHVLIARRAAEIIHSVDRESRVLVVTLAVILDEVVEIKLRIIIVAAAAIDHICVVGVGHCRRSLQAGQWPPADTRGR